MSWSLLELVLLALGITLGFALHLENQTHEQLKQVIGKFTD